MRLPFRNHTNGFICFLIGFGVTPSSLIFGNFPHQFPIFGRPCSESHHPSAYIRVMHAKAESIIYTCFKDKSRSHDQHQCTPILNQNKSSSKLFDIKFSFSHICAPFLKISQTSKIWGLLFSVRYPQGNISFYILSDFRAEGHSKSI